LTEKGGQTIKKRENRKIKRTQKHNSLAYKKKSKK